MQPIMMTSAQDIYRKQSILTASPAELIVMLYEGLKKNLLLAKKAIEKHDAPAAHLKLMKAQAIVAELVNSLDMSVPLSEELLALYDYMLYAMGETNLKKDAALIDPLVAIVQELKEAWEFVAAPAISQNVSHTTPDEA